METLTKSTKNLIYECTRIWTRAVTYSRLKIFILSIVKSRNSTAVRYFCHVLQSSMQSTPKEGKFLAPNLSTSLLWSTVLWSADLCKLNSASFGKEYPWHIMPFLTSLHKQCLGRNRMPRRHKPTQYSSSFYTYVCNIIFEHPVALTYRSLIHFRL
jgi:hypothetical protein